jgi:oligoendopeptidase F
MFDALPMTPQGLMDLTWTNLESCYRDLESRHLTEGNVAGFLADWTRVSESIDEAYSRLNVATTVNTADKAAEERYHRFLDTMLPPVEEADNRLQKKLLESGVRPPRGFEIPMLKMRTEVEIFREANIPLSIHDRKLCTEYDKVIGSQTVSWEGKEITIAQIRPFLQDTDRSVRENAWRTALQRQLVDSDAINVLWGQFLECRGKIAANAGFGEYRSYRWKQMMRFDYTPEDCRRFHEAIERVVVPAAARIAEHRRATLGVGTLRPWDLDVDLFGRPPLKPFTEVSDLIGMTGAMFERLDPALGGYYRRMVELDLLDLDNRKNKAPGGYCTEFAATKCPFIFMNAVGLHDDVQTLLHESGHAFHTFERSDLPYYQQRSVSLEFAEVASMAMELLAAPYLSRDRGGFYSTEDAARARIEHLEKCILFWPYMAVVDAFQHWVYENPIDAADPAQCDREWTAQWRRFMNWIDWTGLETELATGWHRKLHIHTVPLYYVEYGLAQLGAAQVWSASLHDAPGAIANYRRALALGGTVPLPELFSTAGARFAFDADTLGIMVSLMEQVVGELRGV